MAEDKSPAASAVPTTSEPSMAGEKPESAAPIDAPAPTENQTQSLVDSAEASAKANGDKDPEATVNTNESVTETQDTEMGDAADNTETVTEGVNGTPASSKKALNGSAKKKSAAVPEHKSKKLNRKKSKTTLHLNATPGDLYLARWKGAQPWPSVICDEEMLPSSLLKTRPVTTAQPDGTFKKPEYEPGGKREHERTFPIMFLHTNEFAWIPNTDLSPVDPDECKEVVEKGKGKSKSLLEAYVVASEGHDLDYFKSMLIEHQEAMVEDAERRAEREAKKAQKSKRKSEPATTVEDADDDEMDIDDEDQESKPKTKKRKKSLDSEGAEEKPAKTPKTKATKLKLTTPKVPESSGKKKTPKPKSTTKKAAAKASGSDDEMMVDTPMVEEKPLTPAEAKEKKEKEIRYYRHKLQKGFLSRDTIPGEEEVKSMSGYLTKLETYPDLEGSIIRATKIHKVLKAMIRLQSIPQDDEYTFKKRSIDLLSKWNKILAEDPSGNTADKDDDKTDDKPETNGTGKTEDEDTTKSEPAVAATTTAADDGKKIEAEKPQKNSETEKTSEPAAPAKETETEESKADKIPAENSKTAATEAVESTA